MIEISDREYWKEMDYYSGLLYCSLLDIDGKDNWRMMYNYREYMKYLGYEYLGGYHGIWREVPESNKWYMDDNKYNIDKWLMVRDYWVIPVRDY
jgi:hypothetical protein